MKKILTTFLLIIGLSLFAQTNSFAQQHGPTKLGAGLMYGEAPDAVGINVNATFRVSPQIAIAPDISIYFPEDEELPFLDSFWAINLNGHYIFTAENEYHIYGLGGLNLATAEPSVPGDSESELGINLGVGGEYHLENFSLYSELKYVVGEFDQVVIGVGARFPI
jgi:hypothetical protein